MYDRSNLSHSNYTNVWHSCFYLRSNALSTTQESVTHILLKAMKYHNETILLDLSAGQSTVDS